MEVNMEENKASPRKYERLYRVTPTLLSEPMSRHAGFNVYLKLENLQSPGSFKIRGSGEIYQKAVQNGYRKIICASAGNAGITAAYVGKMLGVPVTIVVPVNTQRGFLQKMRDQGATVVQHGRVFDESLTHAVSLANEPDILPPTCLQNPDCWAAYSTIITEAKDQMPCKPDVIICCVGRGDLLNGVITGIDSVGWKDVPVVAMETYGADSYNSSVKAGKTVILPELTSVANCLGALRCSSTAIRNYKMYNIASCLVDDKTAVHSCMKFADDHRMLVDVACGASLSAIYGDVISGLQSEGKLGKIENALIVVCGGNVTMDMMIKLKQKFDI